VVLSLFAVAGLSPRVRAQEEDTRPRPELRADAIIARHTTALQAGAGVQIPAGYYARIGIDGAAGVDVSQSSGSIASGRVDVIARFLFDPFRQQRWGFSAGGGVSARVRSGDHVRPFLVAVLDLEAPRTSSGVSPAFQLGLGGGVRIGMALRWGAPRTR